MMKSSMLFQGRPFLAMSIRRPLHVIHMISVPMQEGVFLLFFSAVLLHKFVSNNSEGKHLSCAVGVDLC